MVDVLLVTLVSAGSAVAGFGIGAAIMAHRIPTVLARMTARQLSAVADRVQRVREGL